MTPQQSPEQQLRRDLPSSPAAATSTCSTVQGAAKMPIELIVEVLSRLPLRSLYRFQCVSKGWRALLQDPIFVAAHKSLNAETFIVATFSHIVPRGSCELRLMDMDGKDARVIKEINCTRLLSSSMDDLVCVIDESYDGPRVINPANGEVLVDCPKLVGVESWEAWRAVFGFGRAIPSGTYKVLRFLSGRGCEVFSLGDGAGWRPSECPPADLPSEQSSFVAVSGVMYFLVTRKLYGDTLLCYDIQNEEWTKAIEGPQQIVRHKERSWTRLITIAELNNTVCMVDLHPNAQSTPYQCAKIWLLEDSRKDTWIKVYTIPMVEFTYRCRPLGLTLTRDGGKVIFSCSPNAEGQILKVYDPRTDTCTTLRRLGNLVDSISLCSGADLDLEFTGAAEPSHAIS
ncbi:unnamed protein product [Alopecurus aequalis]